MPGMPERVGHDEEHVGHPHVVLGRDIRAIMPGIIYENMDCKSGTEGRKVGRAPQPARSRLLRAGGCALFRRRPDDGFNLKFTCAPNVPCRGLQGHSGSQVRAKSLHLGLWCCLEVLLLQIGVAGEFQVAGDARTGRA